MSGIPMRDPGLSAFGGLSFVSTMLSQRNIFLIGPMGSGKTAVGKNLARLFHFTFHDSDADVEAKTGVDIAFIFEKEGEDGFRVRERDAIERLTHRSEER